MNKRIKRIALVCIASGVLQAILILYKHLIGYVPLTGLAHFFVIWLNATFFTALMLALILSIDLTIITALDSRWSWQMSIGKRLITETGVTIAAGIFIGSLLTLIAQLLWGYEQPLAQVYLINATIGLIANLVLMAILEAIRFFRQHQDSLLRTQVLERENIRLRFETLKKQLDPHFLFNSLNVLSSLIKNDRDKAQQFIDEFSTVYRYILDVIDKPVVTVQNELDFVASYSYLQQIRFGQAIEIRYSVDDSILQRWIPPLAVQCLLENAFKHNIATPEQPLLIRIESRDNRLLVINRLQLKDRSETGRGMGLENLKNRYLLLGEPSPDVVLTGSDYIVGLPLIEAD
ncbi:histidine kinase [candidate division KSB1 bacterium]|nr:histidine kinase [candidate division KSB1 bacterium]